MDDAYACDPFVQGCALALSAQKHPAFTAFALARWADDNPRSKLEQRLGCGPETVWKLSVTPCPPRGTLFVQAVTQLATAYKADPGALLELLEAVDAD